MDMRDCGVLRTGESTGPFKPRCNAVVWAISELE